VIGAHMAAGEADTVLLHIQAVGGCAASTTDPATAASLGAALCMEIAAEMRGELQSLHNDGAAPSYRLQLPDGAARVPALPGRPG
jgi:hypothetical protein